MDEFFIRDFTGGPFVLFSTQHWVAIILIVLFNLSFLFLRRNEKPETLRGWRYTDSHTMEAIESASCC